jgi:predicted nucleic acid-binding protein
MSLRDGPRRRSLDLGERAAIALATANPPCVLLIDERAGTAVARSPGLSVTGTLGVLDEASRRKLISLPDAIERLKRTSFRYPKLIVNRLLEEDAPRPSPPTPENPRAVDAETEPRPATSA